MSVEEAGQAWVSACARLVFEGSSSVSLACSMFAPAPEPLHLLISLLRMFFPSLSRLLWHMLLIPVVLPQGSCPWYSKPGKSPLWKIMIRAPFCSWPVTQSVSFTPEIEHWVFFFFPFVWFPRLGYWAMDWIISYISSCIRIRDLVDGRDWVWVGAGPRVSLLSDFSFLPSYIIYIVI